jgi:small subunit ribosomal protein S3
MGQKVKREAFVMGKTTGFSSGANLNASSSSWFSKNRKEISDFVKDDFFIRSFILKSYREALISRILISRGQSKIANISIYSAKPSLIVGKIDAMKISSEYLNSKSLFGCKISVLPIKKPELEAAVAAEIISQSIESMRSYKKSAKVAISSALKSGAKGVKIIISGRLNGAEIARSEKFLEGSVPLSTIRSDISYSASKAFTKYGVVGVSVWINR